MNTTSDGPLTVTPGPLRSWSITASNHRGERAAFTVQATTKQGAINTAARDPRCPRFAKINAR